MAQGDEFSYDQLEELAMEAESFRSLIDPDHMSFNRPGPMAQRIREYCGRQGQPLPASPHQLLRTVFDSLACKYRIVFEGLASFAAKPLNALRVVGGGSKNHFFEPVYGQCPQLSGKRRAGGGNFPGECADADVRLRRPGFPGAGARPGGKILSLRGLSSRAGAGLAGAGGAAPANDALTTDGEKSSEFRVQSSERGGIGALGRAN